MFTLCYPLSRHVGPLSYISHWHLCRQALLLLFIWRKFLRINAWLTFSLFFLFIRFWFTLNLNPNVLALLDCLYIYRFNKEVIFVHWKNIIFRWKICHWVLEDIFQLVDNITIFFLTFLLILFGFINSHSNPIHPPPPHPLAFVICPLPL